MILTILSAPSLCAQPQISSVADAVNGGNKLCPGSLAVLSGSALGQNPQVTVGGKTAFNVTPPAGGPQMTIEIPVDAPVGSATVIVTTTAGGPSTPFNITLAQFAPVLLTNFNGSVVSPAHQSNGAVVTSANPAMPGEAVVVYAIGLGPTNPVVPTGNTSPQPAAFTTAKPSVNLGPTTATNVTASLVPGYVGYYQVTFTVPAGTPAGSLGVTVTVGGATSNSVPLAVGALSTTPTITSLANNYSYVLPGLPHYGIAQGSIFDIFGTNLANTSTGLQSVPLSASLKGVTVTVTVGGAATHPILYYVTPGQIAAILPSATPVGTGTIVVDNNGQSSAPAPIVVVQSAFGILTLNGLGDGPAAAFDVNSNYLGYTNALNPGEAFVLWGTGVGPVTGDETVAQTPVDLTAVPFSVEVGGLPAQLYYHGRSQYPGLDQVIAFVPAGVLPGCAVSVIARSGNIVSNQAFLPVAASGRTCAEPTEGFTSTALQTIEPKSSFGLGIVTLSKSTFAMPASGGASAGTAVTDHVELQFLNVPTGQFNGADLQNPSAGSCHVYGFTGTSAPGAPNAISVTPLDAGASIKVAGPNGSLAVNYQSNQQKYGGDIGGTTSTGTTLPLFIPATGGAFTFTGAGGAGVGAFTANLAFDTPILTWTNQATISTVTRTSGVTISWTGSTSDFVQIGGESYTSGANQVGAQFLCSAPASAGQFTVPASVLLALPPSGVPSILWVTQLSLGTPFTATGIDADIVWGKLQTTIPVTYK